MRRAEPPPPPPLQTEFRAGWLIFEFAPRTLQIMRRSRGPWTETDLMGDVSIWARHNQVSGDVVSTARRGFRVSWTAREPDVKSAVSDCVQLATTAALLPPDSPRRFRVAIAAKPNKFFTVAAAAAENSVRLNGVERYGLSDYPDSTECTLK
jgi:hypothetical protein